MGFNFLKTRSSSSFSACVRIRLGLITKKTQIGLKIKNINIKKTSKMTLSSTLDGQKLFYTFFTFYSIFMFFFNVFDTFFDPKKHTNPLKTLRYFKLNSTVGQNR